MPEKIPPPTHPAGDFEHDVDDTAIFPTTLEHSTKQDQGASTNKDKKNPSEIHNW